MVPHFTKTARAVNERLLGGGAADASANRYSTVTLLARFRGLSTSQPRATAM